MGLSDVAGVFSRPFIIGYFLPAFAALVLYSVTVSHELLPNLYEGYGSGTQIAILGATGLLLGLLVLGLNYPILRLFEGYPLVSLVQWLQSPRRHKHWRPLARRLESLRDRLVGRQKDRWQALRKLRDEAMDPEHAGVAAWQLDRCFPRKQSHLLPTSFGNAVRAFETHSSHRWGLDGIAAAPRISVLLSDNELAVQADARSEVAFFVNFALLTLLLWLAWIVDLLVAQPVVWYAIPVYLVPVLVAYGFYRAAIGAAQRWGSTVRAGIDLHRLELYERIGVGHAKSFREERLLIGPAVSRCFLHGNRIPDRLHVRFNPPAQSEEETGDSDG